MKEKTLKYWNDLNILEKFWYLFFLAITLIVSLFFKYILINLFKVIIKTLKIIGISKAFTILVKTFKETNNK